MCVLVLPIMRFQKKGEFTFLTFTASEPGEGDPVFWEMTASLACFCLRRSAGSVFPGAFSLLKVQPWVT